LPIGSKGEKALQGKSLGTLFVRLSYNATVSEEALAESAMRVRSRSQKADAAAEAERIRNLTIRVVNLQGEGLYLKGAAVHPYVMLTQPKARTNAPKSKTGNVTFESLEGFHVHWPGKGPLPTVELSVWDEHTFGSDEFIGSGKLALEPTMFATGAAGPEQIIRLKARSTEYFPQDEALQGKSLGSLCVRLEYNGTIPKEMLDESAARMKKAKQLAAAKAAAKTGTAAKAARLKPEGSEILKESEEPEKATEGAADDKALLLEVREKRAEKERTEAARKRAEIEAGWAEMCHDEAVVHCRRRKQAEEEAAKKAAEAAKTVSSKKPCKYVEAFFSSINSEQLKKHCELCLQCKSPADVHRYYDEDPEALAESAMRVKAKQDAMEAAEALARKADRLRIYGDY